MAFNSFQATHFPRMLQFLQRFVRRFADYRMTAFDPKRTFAVAQKAQILPCITLANLALSAKQAVNVLC